MRSDPARVDLLRTRDLRDRYYQAAPLSNAHSDSRGHPCGLNLRQHGLSLTAGLEPVLDARGVSNTWRPSPHDWRRLNHEEVTK